MSLRAMIIWHFMNYFTVWRISGWIRMQSERFSYLRVMIIWHLNQPPSHPRLSEL